MTVNKDKVKPKTDKVKPKTETVAEFLTRGGKINVIPYVPVVIESITRSTTYKVPKIYTLEEGAHLFGEKRSKGKRSSDT